MIIGSRGFYLNVNCIFTSSPSLIFSAFLTAALIGIQYSFFFVGNKQVCHVVFPTVIFILIWPHPNPGSFTAFISSARNLSIFTKYQEALLPEYFHTFDSALNVGFGCMV